MPLGAIIAGVGAVGGTLLGSSGGNATAEAQNTAGNIAGVGSLGISPDNSFSVSENNFSNLSNLFAQAAQQQLFQAGGPPAFDLNALGLGTSALAGNTGAVNNQFATLQQALQPQSEFNIDDFARRQLQRLDSLAADGEATAASQTANALFSRGRLGGADTVSGNAFEALDRSQRDAQTNRELASIDLAGRERDRLFNEGQVGVNNQFNLLSQLLNQQQFGFANLGGIFNANQASQQNFLQNALGLGAGSANALAPNFNALTLAQNIRSSDQASRAGVSSANAQIDAKQNAAAGNTLAEGFGSLGQAIFENRNT